MLHIVGGGVPLSAGVANNALASELAKKTCIVAVETQQNAFMGGHKRVYVSGVE
jgi:hypothetical protein